MKHQQLSRQIPAQDGPEQAMPEHKGSTLKTALRDQFGHIPLCVPMIESHERGTMPDDDLPVAKSHASRPKAKMPE
jgi:hypothetical protein